MISRYKLDHMVAGLLGTFVSRYNDYEGYWSPGVFYRETYGAGRRAEFDLLAGATEPASAAGASVARTYAVHTRVALAAHGLAPDDLAAVTLEFGLPPVPILPGSVARGDPFVCTVRLRSSEGREAVRQAWGTACPTTRSRAGAADAIGPTGPTRP